MPDEHQPDDGSRQAEGDRDVTELLQAWSDGDQVAYRHLWPQIYDNLLSIARRHLRSERRDHTLQTHDLIHEAFLRLVGTDRMRWQDRVHFFAVSAQAMRRILVDHARRRSYAKRDGGQRLPLDDVVALSQERTPELLALDDALRRLSEEDADLGKIVELRYFGGMSHQEVATLIGSSERTTRRRWRLAKAWLFEDLAHE